MVVAAAALAAQPDRAMAGVLLAGLLGLASATRTRATIAATAAAALAFGWTLLTPEMLPAVPYVDRIFYTAFDVHPLAGFAVLIARLRPPRSRLCRPDRRRRRASPVLAFGGCWLAVWLRPPSAIIRPRSSLWRSAVLGYC